MICVLGDAHIDVVVRVSWPLAEETDTPATTALGVGGQAANVAVWVRALGGRSRLIAARGTDPAERLVADGLAHRGVQVVGPVKPGRTGVVVSLSDGGQKRSMLTDRGIGTELAAADLRVEWLDGCDWLHIPAYSFAREPVRGAALAAAAAGRARSVRISVDLSSTAMIEAYGIGGFRELIASLEPDVVFGTEAEAALVAGVLDERLVVKLGADGVRAGGRRYPAVQAVAVDSTGAGDAFAAGYLLGGVELGLAAAARAVAKMGAMP
jgi:sugar/nucleoside kinase (ribokinase family)